MCYILYGAMDRSVNIRDYDRASQRHTYRFPLGTRHDVKMCILNNGDAFRVTDWICDCDFPVGKGDEHAPELKDLAGLILELKQTRDAKCLYLTKVWNGKRNGKEKESQTGNGLLTPDRSDAERPGFHLSPPEHERLFAFGRA